MDSKPEFYKLGLLGHPLGHSRSPEMHKRALAHCNLQGSYELIDIPEFPESELASTVQRLKDEGYAGFNVTIPYKEKIIPLLDSVPGPPLKLGAVNTVKIDYSSGHATGFNTDITGITLTILDHFKDPRLMSNLHAIVLGSGGAARACVYALQLIGCRDIQIWARNEVKAQRVADDFKNILPRLLRISIANVRSEKCQVSTVNCQLTADTFFHLEPILLINATPLGQAGKEPVEPEFFDELLSHLPENTFVFDMVYASGEQKVTPLVDAAQKRGLKACDGTFMLARQAAEAFKIWTGRSVSEQVMLGREPIS